MNTHTDNNPKLTFSHPNHMGTGMALQFALRPAGEVNNEPGAILGAIVKQNGKDSFDYKNPVSFSLDFNDTCRMLQVLRGETESINDGKGILKHSNGGYLKIYFEHRVDPTFEYVLEIIDQDNRIFFSLSPAEALGLSVVLENALFSMAFGRANDSDFLSFALNIGSKQAVDIAATEAKKEAEEGVFDHKAYDNITKDLSDEDKDKLDEDTAKSCAIGMLCSYYGKEYIKDIENAVERACGGSGITAEERRLGLEALGEKHPIWKYVTHINN